MTHEKHPLRRRPDRWQVLFRLSIFAIGFGFGVLFTVMWGIAP